MLARIKQEALKVVEPWGLPQYSFAGRSRSRSAPSDRQDLRVSAAPGGPAAGARTDRRRRGRESTPGTRRPTTRKRASTSPTSRRPTAGSSPASARTGCTSSTHLDRRGFSARSPSPASPTPRACSSSETRRSCSCRDPTRSETSRRRQRRSSTCPTPRLPGSCASTGWTARLVVGPSHRRQGPGRPHARTPRWCSRRRTAQPRSERRALAENKRRIQASDFEDWVAPGTGCGDAYQTQSDSGLATLAVRTLDPQGGGARAGSVRAQRRADRVREPDRPLRRDDPARGARGEVHREHAAEAADERPSTGSTSPTPTSPPTSDRERSREPSSTSSPSPSTTVTSGSRRPADGGTTAPTARSACCDPPVIASNEIGARAWSRQERAHHRCPLRRRSRLRGHLRAGVLRSAVRHRPEGSDEARATGALEIRGLSSYLHPTENPGRLISVGRDDDQTAGPCTTRSPQLSLFDVANPDSPRLMHRTVLDPGSSEAESDHHAFLYWPATDLVVLPAPVGQRRPAAAAPAAEPAVEVAAAATAASAVPSQSRSPVPSAPGLGRRHHRGRTDHPPAARTRSGPAGLRDRGPGDHASRARRRHQRPRHPPGPGLQQLLSFE